MDNQFLLPFRFSRIFSGRHTSNNRPGRKLETDDADKSPGGSALSSSAPFLSPEPVHSKKYQQSCQARLTGLATEETGMAIPAGPEAPRGSFACKYCSIMKRNAGSGPRFGNSYGVACADCLRAAGDIEE